MDPVVVNFTQVCRLFPAEAADPAAVGLSVQDEALLGRALAALEDAQEEARATAGGAEVDDVLLAPNDQATALLQSYLAKVASDNGKLETTPSGATEARFDSNDIGWLRAAIPFIRERLGIARRSPRPAFSQTIEVIPDHAKVALLGDWGTGLYGAVPCAESITSEGGYDALIHLGDVYYAGTENEIDSRFLGIWKGMAAASPQALSRACNSNHEMYSGGGPLFSRTLPTFGQPSTTFAVCNENWVLIGLDSAYHDHDLDDEQVAWLHGVLEVAGDRRIVLLSHHQPFSLLSNQGPRLVARLAPVLKTQRVVAWYWGHEHLLAVYDRNSVWGVNGRCVGHGGFPYFRVDFANAPTENLVGRNVFRFVAGHDDVPGARILDGPNDYLGDRADRYGPNGFMRLTLSGRRLVEDVVAPDGTVLWTGSLP
jgi:predicted phosphodiesterase